jgi:thiamine-monophosphate kinase
MDADLKSLIPGSILNLVPRNPAQPGELALIERIRTRASALHSKSLRLGIGDDCAILTPPPNHDLLVTTDFSLEGRHFLRTLHSPQSIGHRTLARGLSDLAAMGATPLACFLSLALPKSIARNPTWLEAFLAGLLTLAKLHHIPLAGGDTSESPSDHILADILLLGTAPKSRALRRSTARPGDLLYVTGTLGGAAAELAALTKNPGAPHLDSEMWVSTDPRSSDHPHLVPQPRITVGQTLLRRRLATACIDLSDGLSTDLNHLCTGSNVSTELDIAALPLHLLAAQLDNHAHITAALHGGEDYELLFTASPTTKIPRSIAKVPITRIGRITRKSKARPRMSIVDANTRFELKPQGWEHLK